MVNTIDNDPVTSGLSRSLSGGDLDFLLLAKPVVYLLRWEKPS